MLQLKLLLFPNWGATIDLGALADNWRKLAARGRAAVVKAQRIRDRPRRSRARPLGGRRARVFRRPFERGGRGAPGAEAAIYACSTASRWCADPEDGRHRLAPVIGGEGVPALVRLRCATGQDLALRFASRYGTWLRVRARPGCSRCGGAWLSQRGRFCARSHFVRPSFAVRSHQRGADRSCPRLPRRLPEPARLRQFIGHVPGGAPDPRRGRVTRSTGRQSDAGPPQSYAPRRDACRRHPAEPLDRGRHELRL